MKYIELKTCCFTGHRPKSLPWGYKEKGRGFKDFKKELKKEILNAIGNGYGNFISGMAMGMDLVAAEMVLNLKKKHPNLKLECAIPCLNQTNKWESSFVKRYNKVLKSADKTTMVSNSNYFNGCMQKRNRYMVDSSSLLIALYNSSPGGTKQTIDYAKLRKKDIVIISCRKL